MTTKQIIEEVVKACAEVCQVEFKITDNKILQKKKEILALLPSLIEKYGESNEQQAESEPVAWCIYGQKSPKYRSFEIPPFRVFTIQQDKRCAEQELYWYRMNDPRGVYSLLPLTFPNGAAAEVYQKE
jgi:hypothetical protein